MTTMVNHSKITSDHLTRKAIVYLRQSTIKQVIHNKESQKLQYALIDRVKSLGFTDIEVIDLDLGVSAGLASNQREGFKQVLASVALGEVGMVMSRELSRLSRTDKDWCHLLEVCQLFNTLIGDAEQVYDLNGLDDQLMLGIKGTMSVAELKVLKMRMQQGKEAKAKRGELFCSLSPGFVKDGKDRIIKDPNIRVQEAIALVFVKFLELSSIRKTHGWFVDNKIKLPVNKSEKGSFELKWKMPTLSFISNVLHNPLYAGAYVYGRRPIKVRFVEGHPVKSQDRFLPLDQAKVFHRDAHQGYISWQTYERIQRMIEDNAGNFQADQATMAVRQGQGLLTGLLRCGRCGRKLQIRYYGKAGTTGRYLCPGEYPQGGSYCLGFGSRLVDRQVGEHIIKALSPLGLEASLKAMERLQQAESDQHRALTRELQQLEYEAQRTFKQYDQVDPTNRLVAQSLEQRLNEKLQAVQQVKDRLVTEKPTSILTEHAKQHIWFLGENFNQLWHDPACPMELKKKMARLLIEHIFVDEHDEQLSLIIHWAGGCHTSITMDKPQSAATAHATQEEDLDIIKKMACYSDEQIAQVLCRLGRRTGKGNRWTKRRVAYIRKTYGIAYQTQAPNIINQRQAMRYCQVSDKTIKRLIEAKLIMARQVVPYAPLEIKREDLGKEEVVNVLKTLKATGKLHLEGYSPDHQLDLFYENQ